MTSFFFSSQCRVTSTDRDYVANTCVNANTESKSFYVRYDETDPTVGVTLGTFVPKKSADHRKYEDIPLTITVSDNCDPNPEVIVTVFSDETTVTHEFDDKPAAVLERKYSNIGPNGVLQGWGVTLDRYSYAKKMCGPHMECHEADGRFFIVRGKFHLGMLRARCFHRWSIDAPPSNTSLTTPPYQPIQTSTVCAKDYAGHVTCQEKSVGVPLSELELKKIVPENQGKLFVVAEDTGFWNAPPNEIPFRNENLFLNSA